MKVLVTGASGHIGANLVHALVDDGHRPRVFARPTSDLRAIAPLDLEVVHGDVLDPASVRAAVDGCDVVFHAAAVYRNWTPDPGTMSTTALSGTRHVFEACRDAGVQRIVYTSSSNCVGFQGTLDRPLDETHWNDRPHAAYVRAKVDAEREAWRLADDTGIETVAVLPTGVLGRFDYRQTPTTKSFTDALSGKGPLAFDLNLVDVRDVARGHVLAATRGRPGERYLLGGDNIAKDALAELMEAELGVRPQTKPPPVWLLGTIAWVAEALSGLTGAEPMITKGMVQELRDANGVLFDTTKARTELGLDPASPADVVRETARWTAFAGLLPDDLAARIGATLPPDPAWPAPPS